MERAVGSLTVDLLLGDDSPKEGVVVKMKPNFTTACWSFLPPHRIYIGEQCLSRAKPGLAEADRKEYLRSFFRHEVGHLKRTERDLSLMEKLLQTAGVPFGLWNLFEDAWMEHAEREESGEPFQWAKFEDVEEPASDKPIRPCSEFFFLIQTENTMRDVCNPEVQDFYDRAVAAQDSKSLIPIMQQWVERFGDEAPPARFESELKQSLMLQSSTAVVDEFDQDAFAPGTARKPAAGATKIASGGHSDLLGDECSDVDFARAEKLAGKFLGLFGSRVVTTRSNEPSNRISARHLELDRPCYSRKTTVHSVAKVLELVVDCSGSMDGKPMEDARLLVWALSYLASLGKIRGHLILSGVLEGVATSNVFDFPVSKEVVQRMQVCYGADGLNSAILQNLKLLERSDMVFVKTDGDIQDEPLDRRTVKRKGILVCGLYSCGVRAVPNMAKHFDRFFARNSLESLIEALLQSRIA
jgi:hypothetical protein